MNNTIKKNEISLRGDNRNVIIYLAKMNSPQFAFMLDALICFHNENLNKIDDPSIKAALIIPYDYLSYHTGLSIHDVHRYIKILHQSGFIHVYRSDHDLVRSYELNVDYINIHIRESEERFDKWFGYMMDVYDKYDSHENDQTKIKNCDNFIHSDASLDEIFSKKDSKGSYITLSGRRVYKEEYKEKIKIYYPDLDNIRMRIFWDNDEDQKAEYDGPICGWLYKQHYKRSQEELKEEEIISYIHYLLVCKENGEDSYKKENVYSAFEEEFYGLDNI